MDLTSLGMRIRSARKERGMTLEALSKKVGISLNFLWEIEAGRKAPALPTLYNLAIALNISVDYLLGVTAEKRPISGQARATERDLEVGRIVKEISCYGPRELFLLSRIVSDFSKYIDQA